MIDSNNMGEENVHNESTELELKQRLAEEITILRIEGTLFCFDPREARRRAGTITRTLKHADGQERPVSIRIDTEFGQPSVLAYKIVQAIFFENDRRGLSLFQHGLIHPARAWSSDGAHHLGRER